MFDRSVLWSNDTQAARAALEALLTECQGNVTLASRRAAIERQSMHRLLKRHGLSARDFRPRGGGSIIARAALKNLDQQLTPKPQVREFARTVVRDAAGELGRRGDSAPPSRASGATALTSAAPSARREPTSPPNPVSASASARRERASLAPPSYPTRDRAPLSMPVAQQRPPLIDRPITAGELADRAFERRRSSAAHHRPYQSPLGAAALQALGLRKTAG